MRRFLIGALLLFAACGQKVDVGVKVDPALAALIPPDTVLLAGTRVEALLKTVVYQKYFAQRSFPQMEKFAQQTGLDVRKDLWELLFVSNGHQGVLLGRGKFANEMEPKLEKQGAQRFVYKGHNLIGNDRAAVMFVNSSTAAVGETAALESLIDHRQESNGPPALLAAQMKEIPAEVQFWAAYAGGSIQLPFPENSNLANVNKLLSSVQSGTVYFDLRTGLNGVATGVCSSEQGAQDVQGALKALVGLGRLSTPADRPELLSAYDSIRITQDSRRVKVYIDVPQELADKFLEVWIGRQR